jgi:alpha-galactosidase
MGTLALRMTSGETAVHSDMVMWSYEESAELAAFQLTRVLFSVPQISVRSSLMNEEHAAMVKRYLELWMKYRQTLVSGKMLYKGYVNNYPYVSARSEKEQVGAVYAGRIAYIEVPTEKIVLFNASMDDNILIDAKNAGVYFCNVYDCCGNEVRKEKISLENLTMVKDVPVNGTVILTAV